MLLRRIFDNYIRLINDEKEIYEPILLRFFSYLENTVFDIVRFYQTLYITDIEINEEIKPNSPVGKMLRILELLPEHIVERDKINILCKEVRVIYNYRNQIVHYRLPDNNINIADNVDSLCSIIENMADIHKDSIVDKIKNGDIDKLPIALGVIGDFGLINDSLFQDALSMRISGCGNHEVIIAYIDCISKQDDIKKAERVINIIETHGNAKLDEYKNEIIKRLYRTFFFDMKSSETITTRDVKDSEINENAENIIKEDTFTLKISKLCELIKQYVEKSNLESLFPEHYDGDFDEKILEYCLENDPEEIFNDLFSLFTIQKVAKEMNIVNYKNCSKKDLIEKVLYLYGFTTRTEIKGINYSIKTLNEAVSKIKFINICDEKEIIGLGMSSFIELEKVLKDIIFFYSICLFGEKYRDFLEANVDKSLGGDKGINNLMLGRIIELINNINTFIRSNEDYIKKMKALFGRESIINNSDLGNYIKAIQCYRVSFSHSNSDKKLSAQELYDQAIQSTEKIRSFLELIRKKNIYPKTVYITQFIEDHYGRRFVFAIDEEGNHLKIFTQEKVDPRYIHYMHGKFNPVILEPILIPRK